MVVDPIQAAQDYVKSNNISGLLQVRAFPSKNLAALSALFSTNRHSDAGATSNVLSKCCSFFSLSPQVLTASLIYHKPSDVKSHLVDILRQMQSASQVEEDVSLSSTNFVGCLFTDDDLSTMFNMYDMNNTGHISKAQALNAVENLVGAEALATLDLTSYLGNGNGPVTQLHFTKACKFALNKVLSKR